MSYPILLHSATGRIPLPSGPYISSRGADHPQGEVQILTVHTGEETQVFSLDRVVMQNVKVAGELFRVLMDGKPAHIEFDNCDLGRGLLALLTTSLKTNEKMRTFALPRTELSTEEAIALLEVLKGTQIEELNLEGSALDNRALNVLAELVQNSRSLTKLTFSPGPKEVGMNWPANFVRVLARNTTLREIVIAEPCARNQAPPFCLDKEDVDTLLEGLRRNMFLTRMDVGPSSQRAFRALYSQEAWSHRWWKKAHEWEHCFARNREEHWIALSQGALPSADFVMGEGGSFAFPSDGREQGE